MAPGVNTYIFADMYGCARRVAATSVLVGTALTVLTAPVWIAVLG
jgi:predicted permease